MPKDIKEYTDKQARHQKSWNHNSILNSLCKNDQGIGPEEGPNGRNPSQALIHTAKLCHI